MKIKVLHCPCIIGGNASGLAKGERGLGMDSVAAILNKEMNPYGYDIDIVIYSGSKTIWSSQYARWKLLFLAMRCDVIHYNFGKCIMPDFYGRYKGSPGFLSFLSESVFFVYSYLFQYFDLRVLKLLKKVLVVTYQGSDARQDDYCRANFKINAANAENGDCYDNRMDIIKRKRIKKMSQYVDHIYALNPDLLYVLPSGASFLPYSSVDLTEWEPVPVTEESLECPVLVHAPSNRKLKGTGFLLEAVERLKREGVKFHFTLVEGVSNAEAEKIYRSATLLVDQLLYGWYGGLAVELMALGKPVVCYIREKDLMYIPEEMRKEIPLIQATPDSIYDVLKYQLTQGRYELVKLGEKSREFVEKWHDPVKVAKQTKEKYLTLINQRKPSIRKYTEK